MFSIARNFGKLFMRKVLRLSGGMVSAHSGHRFDFDLPRKFINRLLIVIPIRCQLRCDEGGRLEKLFSTTKSY